MEGQIGRGLTLWRECRADRLVQRGHPQWRALVKVAELEEVVDVEEKHWEGPPRTKVV